MLAPARRQSDRAGNDASSLIDVTLNGKRDLVIQSVPVLYPMPIYADILSNQQIADELAFVRAGWKQQGGSTALGAGGEAANAHAGGALVRVECFRL